METIFENLHRTAAFDHLLTGVLNYTATYDKDPITAIQRAAYIALIDGDKAERVEVLRVLRECIERRDKP